MTNRHLQRKLIEMDLIGHAVECGAGPDECAEILKLERLKWSMRRHGLNVELDHYIPKARGGTSRLDNLHIIPKAENRRKGTKHPREFYGHTHNELTGAKFDDPPRKKRRRKKRSRKLQEAR